MRKAVEATPLNFTSVNYGMALRYISKCAKNQAEVDEWALGEWCPRRSFTMGARPGMSGSAEIDTKWTDPVIPQSEADKKKILGKVMELAVVKIFTSNVYTFGGVFRQVSIQNVQKV